ncbi:GTPase Der isoform A [Senna tora]|uniref:GTPase Der n=1 Tax=Senna tora TaxID=362788 RepID=A0A834W638_9FABA|nr:GTPase Der isoform A [Senna tora]
MRENQALDEKTEKGCKEEGRKDCCFAAAPLNRVIIHGAGTKYFGSDCHLISSTIRTCRVLDGRRFCTIPGDELIESDLFASEDANHVDKSCADLDDDCTPIGCLEKSNVDSGHNLVTQKRYEKPVDFTKIEIAKLPTVMIVGRPNVGKSALFNRLIRRREALVYNTPDDHVTRDIREGVAKLSDLRFRVLDSAGLEAEATSGSVLHRTAGMTANVLSRSQFAIFLTDARAGLHPLDLEVGKWLRKNAPQIKPIVVMNKCESLFDSSGSIATAANEMFRLGFGDPIAISAETGLGLPDLYQSLRPVLEDYMLQVLDEEKTQENSYSEDGCAAEVNESKLPLQLAIVGRPNVGKSTLLNTLLQEDRVLVGPEAGLTRDSIRTQFEFQGRTIYLVDTAGWLQRTKQEKGPSSLSIVQSRKNLLRAHIIALVLDAEEIANARRSMKHAEVVIARRAVEEGRGLVVIVNKMDLLRGKNKSSSYTKVMEAVPQEIQTVIPQITGIPVIFTSALEGRGRTALLHQVIDTYEKWCSRLPTARLNRWLLKVMSRHSWKDHSAQPKIKYFTQVKARPPTFVAFLNGKTKLSDTDIRFLTKSLKEDFDLGGIPIRIMQRFITRKDSRGGNSGSKSSSQSISRMAERALSDKRKVSSDSMSNQQKMSLA